MTDEQLIAKYKADLVGEAELARGDLDEIEDHLRTLADELRERGMPRVEAVREACARLGDPRAVAREHARVRTPFGARLSRLRAYSAVALMVPILVMGALTIFPTVGVLSLYGTQIVLGAIITLALALRLSWARPIVVGGVACFTVQVALAQVMAPEPNPMWLVAYAGVLAFVMPWRRHELSPGGWALALQVWAFAAAAFALEFQISSPHWIRFVSSDAELAFFATAIATVGIIVRARWSAGFSAAAALTLAASLFQLLPLSFRFPFGPLMQISILGIVASGALAATIGTILSWRNARSTVGTLRHILS